MLQAALLAGAAVLVSLVGPIVTLTHSFTQYGDEHGYVEVSCMIMGATSNGHGSADGVGGCEQLIEDINTDDSAVYIVIDTSAADKAVSLDIAAAAAAGLIVLAAALEAAGGWSEVAARLSVQAYAAAAAASLATLNYAAQLARALDAAPDPGAESTATVGFGVYVLAALPVVGMMHAATEALLH
jgi:hypothetical protein